MTTTDTQKYSNTMLHKHERTHETFPPQAAAIKLGGARGERNDRDRNIWQLLHIHDGIFKNKKHNRYNSCCKSEEETGTLPAAKFLYFPTAETQTDVVFMMQRCI